MKGRRVMNLLLFLVSLSIVQGDTDLGDGLRYVTTYMPEDCTHKAEIDDVIHYHYVGRLEDTGKVFGRSFDYDSPYIVALGQGRIIAGMDRGLLGTCLWERRKITIPPSLAYGERGVGQIIPPNSTLVFYIRMIRIERNGNALGVKQSLKEVWHRALEEYTAQRWHDAIKSAEEALDMFNEYQKQTMICLKKCETTGLEMVLKKKDQDFVDKLSNDDRHLKQYLKFAAKAKCIKECKKENLPHPLRNPDPIVLEKFKNRVPYSYLHYSYYMVGNLEEGLKCAFTYFFHNPNDSMITKSIQFYKKKMVLKDEEFPSREPGMAAHQSFYEVGKKAYREGKWLEAAEVMEQAVSNYIATIRDCLLMCEDVVYVNFTRDMSPLKYDLLKELDLLPNSMEFYQLLKAIMEAHLQCRASCDHWMSTINGKYYDKYLPGLFNHLQYSYYKLGMLHKAAEATSTFQILEPSDTVMTKNVKYYRSTLGVPYESFKPREDIVDLVRLLETERRILSFILSGSPQKKVGTRGDNGVLMRDEL